MATINKFEEAEIWQAARILVKEVYKVAEKGLQSRDYGFKDQIQRAAVSIMSNTAEGFERGGNKEFVQFLWIAKGSCAEVRSLLYVASDLEYINKQETKRLLAAICHSRTST